MSVGTVYGTASNLPSSWPAGLHYSPTTDKYAYSVAHTWQISALDHIHVVAIDVPQSPIGNPNVMTLTLPVSYNLPLQSRIYFFYVSEANPGDQLVFQPVSGGGDTVNGNAISYTFVLTGNPELILALCVNQNYILQVFGSNSAAEGMIPTQLLGLNPELPIFGTADNPPFSGASDMYPGTNAMVAPIDIVPGMDGFLTPSVAVPTKPFQGLLCNVSGVYLINVQMNSSLSYTVGADAGTNLGPYMGRMLEYDSSGSFNGNTNYPAYTPFVPVANPGQSNYTWTINATFFQPLIAGNYYVFASTWDASSSGAIGTGSVNGGIVVCYWTPNVPPLFTPGPSPPPPSPASLVFAANVNPAVFAPLHKQLGGEKAKAIQKAAKAPPPTPPSSSTSPSIQSSQISLNDIEVIVKRAVEAERRAAAAASSPAASSSSSSTLPSTPAAPASKKRRTTSAFEKE